MSINRDLYLKQKLGYVPKKNQRKNQFTEDLEAYSKTQKPALSQITYMADVLSREMYFQKKGYTYSEIREALSKVDIATYKVITASFARGMNRRIEEDLLKLHHTETEDEKRIRIAEECGLTFIGYDDDYPNFIGDNDNWNKYTKELIKNNL